jgi:Bacterial low temperature requirement A protein (LtrA)
LSCAAGRCEHFVNDLVYELLTGALWVAGALADGDARLVLWTLAVLVTQGGAWALHWLPGRGRRVDLGHTGVAAGHLIERFRLFFIIALGESVLTTGTAFTAEPFELERLLALAIAFTGTVALWWCYFGDHRATVLRCDGGGCGPLRPMAPTVRSSAVAVMSHATADGSARGLGASAPGR